MIETARLLIRPFTDGDTEELLAIWGDPENERFLGSTPPSSVQEVHGWIESGMPWGVWERDTGELVGDCGLFSNEDGDWELAYGFRRDRWGRGYATEAARACVRYGFDELAIERIVADVPRDNVASQHVLENCGFARFGEDADKLLYEITKPNVPL